MNGSEQLKKDAALVEERLNRCFADEVPYQVLFDAMRYSLLAGGKRIRPVLVMECAKALGGDPEKALTLGISLEMVHTYSLIHDDLPCMDNDDYRRGKLTNHKVFGENMATLAGDGLLTAAFQNITGPEAQAQFSAVQLVKAAQALAFAAGHEGMVAGQVLDLNWETRSDLTEEELGQVHHLKTGALLRCACELGCIAADGTEEQLAALRRYAEKIGLAFQIRDDMLDITSTQEELGKPVGSDAENGKTTYATMFGLEQCQKLVDELSESAANEVAALPEPGFLQWLAGYLAGRKN